MWAELYAGCKAIASASLHQIGQTLNTPQHDCTYASRCISDKLISYSYLSTAGIQFRPHGPMTQPLQYIQSKGFGQMSEDIAEHISYAVAYSPEHKSTFGKTASRKGGQVAASQGPLCA